MERKEEINKLVDQLIELLAADCRELWFKEYAYQLSFQAKIDTIGQVKIIGGKLTEL